MSSVNTDVRRYPEGIRASRRPEIMADAAAVPLTRPALEGRAK
jgi:hypothetical protein